MEKTTEGFNLASRPSATAASSPAAPRIKHCDGVRGNKKELGKTASGARDFDNDPGRPDWAVEPDSATGQGHHTTGALEVASAAGGPRRERLSHPVSPASPSSRRANVLGEGERVAEVFVAKTQVTPAWGAHLRAHDGERGAHVRDSRLSCGIVSRDNTTTRESTTSCATGGRAECGVTIYFSSPSPAVVPIGLAIFEAETRRLS